MEALRAMCGALIPSLPPEEALDGRRDTPRDKDLERFYLASGADSTIPDEVAELAFTRCVWEAGVLHVTLWLLCTRLGTLALCGQLCVSGEFPYVRRFADMPVGRREEALRRWTRARWLIPVKIAFAIVKSLCFNVFYTKVNENSENPCWKAIGFRVPNVKEQRKKHPSEATALRPLDNGVVETRELDDATLLRSLADKGLAVKPATLGDYHAVECDVVIVGSGCGGGVAAAVLASAGHKVLVVEKGDYFTSDDYSSVEGPSMERLYEQGGIFCTSNVTTVLFAGTTVGGGSAVNWSASIRTPREVLKEWSRDHGLPVLGSAAYVQAMDAVCSRLAVTNGCREEGFQNKVVRRGCEALGLPVDCVPRNSSEGHYCGSCYLGCPTGDKRGTDTTWLVDAVEHGAVILAGCKAERFILESSTEGRGKNGRSKKCVGLVATCLSNGITKKLRIEAKDKDLEAFLDEVTVARGPMQAGTDTWALLCSAHQMGSCRMGSSPKEGAVDGRGESWEAEGLYVCDGSLLPTAVGVNPMITIQSLAYCLSMEIAESLA
ncbi:unnamed protein product [Triticum turgidum subsp. durum]|uniref:long-chain-alcohol oxidase n=1 Tax=Triticum turgidum subsp. durum TaxID=4567 RepID=A0A9R0QTH4_TRITD|nr:unnamed protein product [Triticum turgidum subsp. durum]